MRVYTLSGKSGTGKSYQAVNLCKELNISSIIDDGLFICGNKVIAGKSAKRQATKYRAVLAAIFEDEAHAAEVREAIKKENPDSILVLGTSIKMVNKIIDRLDLEEPIQRIYIEDITTEEEREIAQHQRLDLGKHVIPAPTFQLRKQFSGYFMSPQSLLKGLSFHKEKDQTAEKSVVRPTFSYMGKYSISEKVFTEIIDCVAEETGITKEISKVLISHVNQKNVEGLDIYIIMNLNYMPALPDKIREFQKLIETRIHDMTAFNVNRIDLMIKDVV